MNESLVVLEKAKQKYNSFIRTFKEVDKDISEFELLLKRLTDSEATEFKKWTEEIRGAAYAGASVTTVGMIIADVVGCLGMYS